MKRSTVYGIFFLLFLYSCEPNWAVVSRYPEGEKKVVQEYYIENSDTIYTYQKMLAEDGKIKMEGALVNGKRNGLWKSYYPNGVTWSETSFRNGIADGETRTYYKNGNLRYDGANKNGEKMGEWNWYDSSGVFIKSVKFIIEDKK
jgi:antitoxin component YwqK of YwqJK toxin-antitoxin module